VKVDFVVLANGQQACCWLACRLSTQPDCSGPLYQRGGSCLLGQTRSGLSCSIVSETVSHG
jgi:hypothetical protein